MKNGWKTAFGLLALAMLAACKGSGGDQPAEPIAAVRTASADFGSSEPVGMSHEDAFRFMLQASFGANTADLNALRSNGVSQWLVEQTQLPVHGYQNRLQQQRQYTNIREEHLQTLFWERALHGDDQLRQRMVFALSQIVVASMKGAALEKNAWEFGAYADILQNHALGNYCTLIREISVSPVMGLYLTHLGNRKKDPINGYAPDENYARELMQLFTIGLVELDDNGNPLTEETYSQDDVEGLAQVFTGLSWADTSFERPRLNDANRLSPMAGYAPYHEGRPKSFLQTTINVGTDPINSVHAALDHLLAHDNVAPFITRQLIQKLVTSNPSPDYVKRVAEAFEAGTVTLPNGERLGTGKRCDLAATVGAILIDPEARTPPTDPHFGKVRSPLLRVAQFLRTYRNDRNVSTSGAIPSGHALANLENSNRLFHNVFSAPSVFNDYRPGYVAPGTESAEAGLVTPEMQLATTPALVAYINTMANFVDGLETNDHTDLIADYDVDRMVEIASGDTARLVDTVIDELTAGAIGPVNRNAIIEAVNLVRMNGEDPDLTYRRRAMLTALMVTVSPEYMVQQ